MTNTIYESGQYLALNPSWHVEDSAWKARQVMQMLARQAFHPATVCEVGCGAGEILRCLQGHLPACRFTGYEISPQAFELAKTRANDRLRFELGSLSAGAGRFDLALVMDVIEHLEDYYSFLRQVRDHCDVLIAHIPLDMCVNHLLRAKPLADLRRAVGHIHCFTKDSALAVLQEAGFGVVDHFYTKWSIEFPPRSWRRRLALYPRKLLFNLHPDFTARVLGGFSLLVMAKPAR